MRRMKGAAIAVTVGLLAAACSSSGHKGSQATPSAGQSSSAPTASTPATTGSAVATAPASSAPATGAPASAAQAAYKQGGTVTISNEGGATWTCQFNPFNPAVNSQANGFVYEPLVYVNSLKAGAETPMLASSYTWSSDQEVDRLHDPRRHQVERWPTADCGRRCLHLQPAEEGQRARPLLAVDRRRAAECGGKRQSSHTHLRAGGEGVLLLVRRFGHHRAAAHLVDRRRGHEAGHLGRPEPRR